MIRTIRVLLTMTARRIFGDFKIKAGTIRDSFIFLYAAAFYSFIYIYFFCVVFCCDIIRGAFLQLVCDCFCFFCVVVRLFYLGSEIIVGVFYKKMKFLMYTRNYCAV